MTSPPPPVSRALMAAVIGMGILIVIGTAGLIAVVIHRAMAPKAILKPSASSTLSVTASSPQLAYEGGGHILSQAIRPDGTVSLHISDNQGEKIVIWDPATNSIIARFVITP